MPNATITYLPRLDLPTPPTGLPVYYALDGVINGIGSIYVHTPDGTWMRGGRHINPAELPAGGRLKKLGAEN